METKQIDVTCPTCASHLTVDVRTQKVVRSRPAAAGDGEGSRETRDLDDESGWESAMGKVREREGGVQSKLEAALDRERDKSSRLDDLFKKASDELLGDEADPSEK